MNQNLRQQYLSAIGIQSWQLKTASHDNIVVTAPLPPEKRQLDHVPIQIPDAQEFEGKKPDTQPQPEIIESPATVNSMVLEPVQTVESDPQPGLSEKSKTAPNNDLVQDLLTESTVAESPIASHADSEPALLDAELVQSIQSCQQCPARTGRQNALVGQGNVNASVFIICDAPNAEEDRAGHYLTGQTQSLFQAMWNTIGLSNDFFLTGIIKCHSLENYLLEPSELDNCADYLYSQLEQIKPAVVVVFGAAQAQSILKTSQSFNALRGKVHKVTLNQTDYPLVVTYHPAFLLRNPLLKKQAMADLLRIKTALI